jgi:LysR family hydrogen peroxide-inducible transcriptional activator
VSIITHRDFVKKRLVEALKTAITASIPEKVKNNLKERVIPI